MDAYFIIGNNVDLTSFNFKDKFVVGIDKGAYLAYQVGIKLDYAVGDFDSITVDELHVLEEVTKVVKLDPVKDETDTYYALNMFKGFDNLYLLGGISGSRIDHFVANLKLFYDFKHLIMIDNDTVIYEVNSETEIHKDEYKYVSLFALEDVFDLTLTGFKYNLNNHFLSVRSGLGVSNEVLSLGKITYSKGRILLIKTKG